MPRKSSTAVPEIPADLVPEPTLIERQALFLAAIEGGAQSAEAAEQAGVPPVVALRWRADKEFSKRFDSARKPGIAQLKREAARRAMAGSDRLLIFLLNAYAPQEFGAASSPEAEHDLADVILQARRRLGEA